MVVISKQNGHPVSRKGIRFICEGKPYPKGGCDVRNYYSIIYSIILSLSSNQNCKAVFFSDISEARVHVQPDKRFHPICHCCGETVPATHSWTQRTIRDLNLAATRVWITCLSETFLYALPPYQYRRFRSVSSLLTGNPSSGALRSSTMSVHDGKRRCQHVKLDWKTVKNIDKYHLEAKYGQPDYNNLKILAVDEIVVRNRRLPSES